MTEMPTKKNALLDVPTLEALVDRDRTHDCDGYGAHKVCVRVEAVAKLPTRFGDFRIVAFWNNRDGKDHVAIVHGDILGAEDVLTRLHSECLTGEVFGLLRCDCREQLQTAMQALEREGRGVIVYIRQEGRGTGAGTASGW